MCLGQALTPQTCSGPQLCCIQDTGFPVASVSCMASEWKEIRVVVSVFQSLLECSGTDGLGQNIPGEFMSWLCWMLALAKCSSASQAELCGLGWVRAHCVLQLAADRGSGPATRAGPQCAGVLVDCVITARLHCRGLMYSRLPEGGLSLCPAPGVQEHQGVWVDSGIFRRATCRWEGSIPTHLGITPPRCYCWWQGMEHHQHLEKPEANGAWSSHLLIQQNCHATLGTEGQQGGQKHAAPKLEGIQLAPEWQSGVPW